MSDKPKRPNRTQITTMIKTDLLDALNELHERTMAPKSKLLDRAIELLLKEYKNK